VCRGVDRVWPRSRVSAMSTPSMVIVKDTERPVRSLASLHGLTRIADRSELTNLLPSLYALLPLPAASSAVSEALSESIFKFGKGTKVLTEPLIAWAISPSGQGLIGGAEGGELPPALRPV
jgi:hypothetical protein